METKRGHFLLYIFYMRILKMLYHMAQYLQQYWSALNVVHYVSFRALAALLSTLGFSFLYGGWFIERVKVKFSSRSREHTPDNHRKKDNLPTMGGIFIIGIVVLNTLLWCNLAKSSVWVFLLCLVGFGALGAWDDWYKITRHKGISAKTKFSLQLLFGIGIVCLWLWSSDAAT